MQIKELGHVVLYVRDLERSRRFYRDVLGFNEIHSMSGLGGGAAVYSSGRTHHELLLIQVGDDAAPIPDGRRVGMYHFGLKIGDTDDELRAAVADLHAAGAKVVGASDHTVTHALHRGPRRQRDRAVHRRAAGALAHRPLRGAGPGEATPSLIRVRGCASGSRRPATHDLGRRCSTCGGRPTRSSCSSRRGTSTTSIRSSTATLDGPCLEAWTMLAAMAQATRRIRIGCQVTGMIYRHPAVLANMAATIDIISDGRLELGLGAGWNKQETDAYGIPLPPLEASASTGSTKASRRSSPCSPRRRATSTAGTCSSPTRAASRSRCSGRIRRSRSAATARRARCAPSPVGLSSGT